MAGLFYFRLPETISASIFLGTGSKWSNSPDFYKIFDFIKKSRILDLLPPTESETNRDVGINHDLEIRRIIIKAEMMSGIIIL